MALHVYLGRAWRAGVGVTRTAARTTSSCPPPPACRARSPARRRGSRVLCCAPPQGAPPPCPHAPLSCPLTCQDVVHENYVSSRQACLAHIHPPGTQPSGHSCEQDPVARRLQVAQSMRRANYEWEVASRAALASAPLDCCAPYALRGERECARATDGCTYAVLREPAARLEPERCGPGRTPPPPRCVELAPDDACRIKSNEHLDPCAHRPRVIVEIDRSSSAPQSPYTPVCAVETCTPGGNVGICPSGGKTGTCTPGNCAGTYLPGGCAETCLPGGNVGTCTPGSNTVTCTPGGLAGTCQSGGNSGTQGWGPPSICAPGGGVLGSTTVYGARLHCRQPSIVELLGARPLACLSNRYTHTSVALLKAGKSVKPASGDLEGILCSKEQLKEAGLGRVVVDAGADSARPNELPGGRLELCLPPGAQRVAVCVSLKGLAPDSTDATSIMRNPCLATKEIQKKWTSSDYLKTGVQPAGSRCFDPCSPCGPPVPPRCRPGPARRAACLTESKIESKRCSSTAAFLANTVI